MSALIARTQPKAPRSERWLQIALAPSERGALHARIASRFDAMLEQGLVKELAVLRERHRLHADLPSMRSVGYRQAWLHLEGTIGAEELRNRGIFATRQLAKRQLTWLRSTPDIVEFDCLSGTLEAQVVAHVLHEIDPTKVLS
jgi:tRNA dimethylallyltransferase